MKKGSRSIKLLTVMGASFMLFFSISFAHVPKPIPGTPLRELAKETHLQIGTAVMPDFLKENLYRETLTREFNMLVTENHLKWSRVHPLRYSYDFKPVDAMVNLAAANNMTVRGHTLIWQKSVPDWLAPHHDDYEKVRVKWSRDELLSILHDHIKTVVGRYAGRIQYWDVVNEVFTWDPNGGELKKSFWYNVTGSEYIEKAFIWAHEADKKARLFINDYDAEEINAKSDALYALVKDMKERGVPVHGIGFQLHLNLDTPFNFKSFEKNIRRFIALGMEIHFTEVEVGISGKVTEARLDAQADIYRKLMSLALKYPEVKAFVTWGLTDRHGWSSPLEGEGSQVGVHYGSGLLFYGNYVPKPAYFSVTECLRDGC
jgi:endo-1,4-beta-xylanase